MKVSENSDKPRLSVSIVVYRTPLALLQGTLNSLMVAAAQLGEVVVTVVDNASGGDYLRQLQSLLAALPESPGVRVGLLSAGANRGYSAGHNAALEFGPGDYHLVLNPDVELAPDCLATGLDYLAANPDIVLISPCARGSAGGQEFLCKRQPSVLVLALRAFLPKLGERFLPRRMAEYEMRELAQARAPVEVDLASGCFMLMPTAVFLAAGGFNERYFLYFEDFDLSRRLGRFGRLVYHPEVRIVHHGGYAGRKGLRHLRLFAASAWRFFHTYGWHWI